jgi:hypothetical protein
MTKTILFISLIACISGCSSVEVIQYKNNEYFNNLEITDSLSLFVEPIIRVDSAAKYYALKKQNKSPEDLDILCSDLLGSLDDSLFKSIKLNKGITHLLQFTCAKWPWRGQKRHFLVPEIDL